MKTPYWQQEIQRPRSKSVLAYEIYNFKTLPDEHTTIKTLNELIEKGKAIRYFENGWLWYQKL